MEQTNEFIKKPERLISFDALRGFDMFWIIGGGAIFEALAKFTNVPVLNWWTGQLEHKYWEGFNFEDLIFPMFLFIAGVSIPFSIKKRLLLGHSRMELLQKNGHMIKVKPPFFVNAIELVTCCLF